MRKILTALVIVLTATLLGTGVEEAQAATTMVVTPTVWVAMANFWGFLLIVFLVITVVGIPIALLLIATGALG